MHDANRGPAATATATYRRPAEYAANCTPEPGRLLWHELRTSDPRGAREFYSRLFGWAVQPAWAHPDDRALLHLRGTGVATVAPLDRNHGDDSRWLPIIATADVDDCCARAADLRGSVYPSGEERRGTATLEDPQGAVWAVLEPGAAAGSRPTWQRPANHQPTIYRPSGYRPPGYQPAGAPPVAEVREGGPRAGVGSSWPYAHGRGLSPLAPPGTIGRTLLLTPDPLAAREFYGSLLGWRFVEAGRTPVDGRLLGAAWVARTGAGKQAAVLGSTPALRARLPRPSWLPCVSVSSLDESLQTAWTLGATVLLGDVLGPAVGRLGVVQDPTGAVLALVEIGDPGGSGSGPS